MGQRNILASFRTVDQAQRAKEFLVQNGFDIVQIDNISPYPGEGTDQFMNPITGKIESLVNLTLAGNPDSKNADILIAAAPEASGMADGSGMEKNQNVLLTVVTDDEHGESAENIIKKYGGSF
ncbi:hypothetical protein L1765_11845 [Microaerobacter geothermalis]|uniref:hypothetical protein n=1 Tax=Microaerobacter geothermalis TaxID=674972 RepID=UPI001F461224|nr:hypothetical protein [Microaerobacter geothermalis]MCF6094653.1 hypothetical protein [Microaerobacter geothermalis]